MKRKLNPFKIGLFALLGIGLVLGGLLWIGAMEFFKGTKTYAVLFDFSVGGLQNGAPVKYLGVDVGKVSDISIGPDDRYVVVLFSLAADFQVTGTMVVQIDSGGLAGQPFLSLKRVPEQEVPAVQVPFQVKHTVLPVQRGGLAQMEDQAREILQEVEQADIPGLVKQWRQTAQELSSALSGGDIRQTLDNIRAASADLEAILQGLSGTGQAGEWRGVFRDVVATAEALRQSTVELSSQLKALPPDVLADLTKRMEGTVATTEKAIASWDKQADQTLSLLERSVTEINRLLTDMEQLVRSLRESPGQILEQRRSPEPFGR